MKLAARIAIALALVAAPAAAVDLTGTWEGSYSCQGFDGTTAMKNKKKESVLLIAQTATTFSAAIDDTDTYNGATIDDVTDATKKGEAVMDHCGMDPVPLDGTVGEIVRLKAKVDPAKGTGSLSGESIFEANGFVTSCKFKYKRTNPAPTKFVACPI